MEGFGAGEMADLELHCGKGSLKGCGLHWGTETSSSLAHQAQGLAQCPLGMTSVGLSPEPGWLHPRTPRLTGRS